MLMQIVLTPEILLAAYVQGLFPMAESANSSYVHWYCPKMRGQLSIPHLHIPRKLMKSLRRMEIGGKDYEIRINHNFRAVMLACAKVSDNRPETWINKEILEAYCALHNEGHAHSVECWQEGQLVGGLYGVSLGGAFFGESMFSIVSDASKVALIHLIARLWQAGYQILDTQFVNDHLVQFGVYEVTYESYIEELQAILLMPCDFIKEIKNERFIMDDYLKFRIK